MSMTPEMCAKDAQDRAARRELCANGWFETDRGWVLVGSHRKPLSFDAALKAQRSLPADGGGR